MAKIDPLDDVGSLANTTSARAVINNNSQKIEDAFANTLSRDGSGPNQMEADIDLNDHFLMNVADPVSEADAVNLRSVRPLVQEFAAEIVETAVFASQIVDSFTATAGQTTRNLPSSPGSVNNVSVLVDGTALEPGVAFTLSGAELKTLTLTTPLTGGERVVVRYSQALPSGVTEAANVLFTQQGTGAVTRPLQLKEREWVSLEDFGAPANGTGDDSAALALALAAGHKQIRLLPGKNYRFVGTQTISTPVTIEAEGANVSLGAGLLAGANGILVNTNDFTWRGGNLSAAVRVTAIKIEPVGSTISGIQVRGVNFSGFFYDVFAEGDSGLGHYVKDLNVTNCTGVAPVGINAGHFLAIYCDGVTYADNSVEGGYNTSVYGCQNCSNITITGNREFGVVDTVADVEAAIQIEGGVGGPSSDSFCIVSGNTCKHDIWVSDANEVNVTGNTCRRLRLSVGNPGTTGAYRNQFVGNKVAQILCQAFGTPGANDFSADFVANQISANGRTVNGVAIGTAIYVDGAQALNLRFIDNRVMTDATTYACAIARNASMRLYFFNNEFGGKPHSLTSSGGVIYEKNNRNPIFSADCGYVGATPSSDITMALGSWTGFAMATEQVDANAEFTGASATFTPIETGTYRFKGGVLFNVLAAGDDVGLRLYRTSGTPAEQRRLGYMQPGAAGFCFLPFCTDLRLTAGDAIQLQYFHSAAGAGSVLAGATLTQLQITREA